MSGDVSKTINGLINSGTWTSVDVYRALGDDKDARRYLLTYHLDEELEAYLGM